jgi:uncharacterized membrane protein
VLGSPRKMNMQTERSMEMRLRWSVVDYVRPSEGWHVVRVAAALVLFIAAATKCHQCCTGPIPGTGLFSAKWFVICLVGAEWFGSLVLLANILPKPSWAAALTCFSAFALVAMGKGLAGEASCHCFGRWEVNPFWTATMDVAIVVSLLRWRPRQVAADSRQLFARATCVLVVWLAVGVPAALAMGRLHARYAIGCR